METINDRVNKFLEVKGLKKTELARALKISDASVSNICSGKTSPSGQTITAIVREYGVNEHWLRTGEGEMFLPKSDEDIYTDMFAKILKAPPDAKVKRLARAWSKLTDKQQEQFADLIESLAAAYSSEE